MGCGPSKQSEEVHKQTNNTKPKPRVGENGYIDVDLGNRNTAFQAVVKGSAIWVGAPGDKPTGGRTLDGRWYRARGYDGGAPRALGGGGKEPSAAELNIMLALLETVIIKDGKVNQAAESDIMQQVESPLNRQNMINIAKGKSNKAATAVKILRILFAINSAKNCFTAAEKREVKTIFQMEGGVTRRVKRR